LINNNLPLFDSEFALNQFSGNQSLLSKMLDKFCEQYASFSEQLLASVEQNDLNTTKRDVHTIKGVSGNLGMKSLHQASRDLENNFQQTSVAESDIAGFITTLNHTLSAIAQFKASSTAQEGSSEPISNTSSANEQNARQLLLSSLRRKEFITHTKLRAWMGDLSLTSDTLQDLQRAIDDLDYEKAISLLE
jgi:HPt (histidine-containing phosphotransfer) domain-containing protein